MNNLCFMTNLTSSEWAAWVQAIGSVAAIFAAIGIAWWQWRSDIRRREREQQGAGWRAYGSAALFATMLDETILEAEKACGAHDERHVSRHRLVIEGLIKWFDKMDLSPLGPTAAAAMIELHAAAIDAVVCAKGAASYPHKIGELNEIWARVHALRQQLFVKDGQANGVTDRDAASLSP